MNCFIAVSFFVDIHNFCFLAFVEFFQTVEVVVGDVYDVDVTRTWEFNSTAPIRSMVLPTVVMGSPLYLLKVRTDREMCNKRI